MFKRYVAHDEFDGFKRNEFAKKSRGVQELQLDMREVKKRLDKVDENLSELKRGQNNLKYYCLVPVALFICERLYF
jgi:hypothetical protein